MHQVSDCVLLSIHLLSRCHVAGVVVYEATLTLVLLRQGGVKKKASLSVPAPDQAVPTSENAGGDGGYDLSQILIIQYQY